MMVGASTEFEIPPLLRPLGLHDCIPHRGRRLRVNLTYLWRHHRWPSLDRPSRLTELIQCRKLFDHDPRFPALIDKVAVKAFARTLLGDAWITPTLWTGTVLPDRPVWPAPFVVKSRHGCNQRRLVRTGDEDWAAIRRASAQWMRHGYGGWLDEWGYCNVPRGLLVEAFVGPGPVLPIDYKIFVFHGRAAFIQVHLDRESNHHWLVFDRTWARVSCASAEPDPASPRSLEQMIAGAEALARGFDFVRVDLYEVNGAPRFGEMTFYPGSGLEPVTPPALDREMGRLWLGSGAHP